MTKNKTVWFVYIIESEKGNLYTGITTDLERRFQEHLTSKAKGAKFFRTQKAIQIVYREEQKNRSLASKREAFIKKMTRKNKLKLISSITWVLHLGFKQVFVSLFILKIFEGTL